MGWHETLSIRKWDIKCYCAERRHAESHGANLTYPSITFHLHNRHLFSPRGKGGKSKKVRETENDLNTCCSIPPLWFWKMAANILIFVRNVLSCQSSPKYHQLGNCDIDFFNFRHRQVWNFKISNHFKRDWNFIVNFQKYRKQKRKSTKYIVSEWMQSFKTRNFVNLH